MKTRILGRTGLPVSEIGYGAWGIGGGMWVGAQEDESLRALHHAIDRGVNFIDTAIVYGDGQSERLVGRLRRERKETIWVATKIPPKNLVWPAAKGVPVSKVFPGDHIVRSCEQSLRNLDRDSVDLLQLHVWRDEFLEEDGWKDKFLSLKRAGKARFLGISINDHDPGSALRAVASGLFDTVQVIYNIFDQSPEDRLFPACRTHNVGVLARVPLDEGGLTGKLTLETTYPKDDFRNGYFKGDRKREVVERVARIAEDLGIAMEEMAETSIRFTLSHPAVSSVIPGMRSVRHAEANCGSGDGKGLAARRLDALRKHRWVRNYYKS